MGLRSRTCPLCTATRRVHMITLMNRTPEQRRRRRALLDTASGRTVVVLYACAEASEPSADVFAVLRGYAAARDWEVACEVLDAAPPSVPLGRRPKWAEVTALIDRGRTEGVLALRAHWQLGDESEQFDAWLAERGAFVCRVGASTSGDDCHAF